MAANHTQANLGATALPLTIIQPVDVGHLLRELKEIDENLLQDDIRAESKDAKKEAAELKPSADLSDILNQGNLDIKDKKVRTQLIEYFEHLKRDAPVIHISFSSEPTRIFLTKITAWLRKEIDPNLLVIVGLDPGIGAGSIVRTANQVFDFSLSTRLKNNHSILGDKIKQVTAEGVVQSGTKEA